MDVHAAVRMILAESSESDEGASDNEFRDEVIIDDGAVDDEESGDDAVMEVVDAIHQQFVYLRSRNGHELWSREPVTPQVGRVAAYNVIRERQGPTNAVRNVCGLSPTDAFKVFITPDIVRFIVDCTNIEGAQRFNDWRSTDSEEMYRFFGLLIAGGAHHDNKTRVADLWNTEHGRAMYASTMPRNRFTQLLSAIRFDVRANRNENDKFAPIRSVFEQIVTKFRSSYKAGEAVTVDEQLVATRGRCPFKMYMPSKPGKYGVKLWALADAQSFYCLNLQPYIGRTGLVPERGQGQRVVLELTDFLTGSGRNVYMDNFFTSLLLGRTLLGRNLTVTGTIRKNKGEIPQELLPNPNRREQSSLFAFQEDATMVSYVPKKNKAVIMLSTLHKDAAIDPNGAQKPKIITDYNHGKCGVDTLDQLVRSYSCARSTRRWPLTIFFNLLNISCYNALVLFLHIHPEYESTSGRRRKRFLMNLAAQLCARTPTHAASIRRQVVPQSVRHGSKRCGFCPREMDRKVTKVCSECGAGVCKDHMVLKCNLCA